MECVGHVLRRVRFDESGVSLAETLVAAAVAALIATAFLTVFSAFSRSVSLEESRAAALSEVRTAAAAFTVELRQAVRPAADQPIIALLESAGPAAELMFYSDRATDAPGPERYRYYLTDCTATHCNLVREVTVADGPTPPWTYSGAPATRQVVTNVMLGGGPLFLGVDWSSGTETLTTSCDWTTPCAFDLVRIVLRVDPDPDLSAEEPLRVRHEVRLRNA